MSQSNLQRLVQEAADRLAVYLDSANDTATELYSRHAGERSEESMSQLRRRLLDIVQNSRAWANDRAALDVTSELRELVPQAHISINLAAEPLDEEVSSYVDEAVRYAIEISSRHPESPSAAFVGTSFRAHTIVESETIRAYQRAKKVAYESLSKLNEDPSRGYSIHRGLDPVETRLDGTIVLCARWCALNDARTCERCAAADGEISPLFPNIFTLEGPPAHARCRCFTHLWGLGWLWDSEDEPVVEDDIDDDEQEPRCAHVYHRRRHNRGYTPMGDETSKLPDTSMLRAYTPQEVRGATINEAERSVEVVASSEAWDSYDTRIMSSGWDVSRYRANPVVLACHDTKSLHSIIGTGDVRIEDGKLLAKIRFLPAGQSEESDLAWGLYRMGALKGVSVGFQAHSYHEEELPEGHPRSGKRGLVFTRQELVEISAVPVPANPEALARAFEQFRSTTQPDSCLDPHKEPTVDTPITAEVVAPVAVLPRAIADLLKVETEEDAVTEIAKRDLELDQVRSALRAAEERANAAEAELKRRDDSETVQVVDALIKAERISKDKRDSALALARKDMQAFRDLYPSVSEAPKAHLLTRVVKPEPVTARKTQEVTPDPISKRADELIKSGVNYQDAWNQAIQEHRSRNGGV